MKELLARLACVLGIGALLRWRNRNKLLVLMYHGVVDEPLSPFCWHQLPAKAFARQLAWIRKRYQVLPLDKALTLRSKGMLPPRCCAITFDDGYANVATKAAPLLAKHDLPATVFLVTGLVGTKDLVWADRLWLAVANTKEDLVTVSELGLGLQRVDTPEAKASMLEATLTALKAVPRVEKDAVLQALLERLGQAEGTDPGPFAIMDWATVRRLQEEGTFRFGPHSKTHEILSRVEAEEVQRQVVDSCAAVAHRTGRPAMVFAYPNGRRQDFDDRTRAAVRKARIPYALSTIEGLVDDKSDALALPRACVGSDLSVARFRLLCSGL